MNWFCRFLAFFELRLLDLAVQPIIFEIGSNEKEKAHVGISDPDQRKAGDQETAPIGIEQLIAGDQEQQGGHIKAKTILAGKEIKEFPVEQGSSGQALPFTEGPGFGKYFFVRDRPGDTGDRNGEDKKPVDRLRDHFRQSCVYLRDFTLCNACFVLYDSHLPGTTDADRLTACRPPTT